MSYFPSKKEVESVNQLTREIKERTLEHLSSKNLKADMVLVGSIAKRTYIKGEHDIDFFILTENQEEVFKELQILYPSGIHKQGELLIWSGNISNHMVDLVVVKPDHIVVETLAHTDFFNKRLNDKMRREVIKGKAYMKTEGLYGAEVGGITGVCIEELVRLHNTFYNACQFLVDSPKRPFIQDPTKSKSRDLLASVVSRK